jgi:Toprim-like/Protein of unknown function (DUF3991)
MRDEEFERFKSEIDLRAFAASFGYELRRRESWRQSAVMRHSGTHDKIIIKIGRDGHWQYYSVRDDRDNGTIIDFIQFRKNCSLGDVRKELRPWLGRPSLPVPSFSSLSKTEKDRGKVEALFAGMSDLKIGHPYLERQRGLSAATLLQDRFAGRIRIDGHGNAVFPHFDADGLSGYEIRNANFKGFSSGGHKSLFVSNEYPNDRSLVFCESAIDALSYAELYANDHTRYASVSGKLNPQQPELIRAAAARMPHGSEIVAAMDADEDGRRLAAIVQKAVALTGRADLHFRLHEPAGFKDFNDQLRAKALKIVSPRTAIPG